jgi:hypothetical protein
MSSNAFHRIPGGRVREITVGERFELRILEFFDPVTQELYRYLPAIIPTQEFELEMKSSGAEQNRKCRSATKLGTRTLPAQAARAAKTRPFARNQDLSEQKMPWPGSTLGEKNQMGQPDSSGKKYKDFDAA